MKLNNNSLRLQGPVHPDKDSEQGKMVYRVTQTKNSTSRVIFTGKERHMNWHHMMKCLTNVLKCTKYKPGGMNLTLKACQTWSSGFRIRSFLAKCLTLSVLDKSGELDFSTFLSVMHAQIRRENPRDEILRAVRLMDTEKRGFITASELRVRLTGFGEQLTDQEGMIRSWPTL